MFCSFSKEFSDSAYTEIENLFIREYLPIAPGDTVKIYLYGLFLCKNPQHDQSISTMATTLNMSQTHITDAFKFWQEFGLVSVLSENPFTVKYYPVKSVSGAKPRKYKLEKYEEFSKSAQMLIGGRMISTGEYNEYYNIMETYGIKTEAMTMIVKYCVAMKGADIGYRYICKVAKDFGNRGIVTVADVEKELNSYSLRTEQLAQVLSALKIKRNPDIEDLNLYKKWTLDLHFEHDCVVFAASKLKKGNMERLDGFMHELYSTKSFSKEEIEGFMDKKQTVYDLAISINKALSIYEPIIDTVIDTYTNKWLSYGYEREALLYIASHLFKTGNNSLQNMDQLIDELRVKGVIDLSSVNDYFEQSKKIDAFIAKILQTAGVNRKPIPWDRDNIALWKSWNFTEEMILEAAKYASGKSSPIPYMNGILSNWKNKGIFTMAEAVSTTPATTQNNTQEEYNREYERRRTIAVTKAQRNTDMAMSLEGFAKAYERLFSIEKDLAFAEIKSQNETLKTLEKEKSELNAIVATQLNSIGLTIEDLSPKYACKKCNDTGYVGTKRCDCFNKKTV